MINYYNDVKICISKENLNKKGLLNFTDLKSTLTEMHQNANIFRFAKFEENYTKFKNLLNENKE